VVSEHSLDPDDGPVCGDTAICGSSYCGPFTTAEQARWYHQLRSVVARVRPAQWVPWDFVFELGGGAELRLMGHYRYLDADYVYHYEP